VKKPHPQIQVRDFRALGLGVALFVLLTTSACQVAPPVAPVDAAESNAEWQAATRKIEEERGELTGRKVRLEVPAELRHYADRRRFLAVQNAVWSTWHFEIPQNYVELIELIEKGGFVEMQPLGKTYALYGAGESATTARFTHYDAASGKSVVLLGNDDEYEAERAKKADALSKQEAKRAERQAQLSRLPAKNRAARKPLLSQLSQLEEEIKEAVEEQDRLAYFYKDPVRRTMMFSRMRWLKAVAADFAGQSYDLDDPAGRRQFKMRLLAFTRPRTRAVIEEIAGVYHRQFGRHLPITSLYRTIEYQKQLREGNPNATAVAVPPHTTGLAFDVYDRYMTAEEQRFLMGVVAGMKAAGRLEALRENRDHIHIFAFPNDRPPDEEQIAKLLK
jgi:Family of unknown function (DUF5715)